MLCSKSYYPQMSASKRKYPEHGIDRFPDTPTGSESPQSRLIQMIMAHYQLTHLLRTAGMAFNYSFCLLAQELTQHGASCQGQSWEASDERNEPAFAAGDQQSWCGLERRHRLGLTAGASLPGATGCRGSHAGCGLSWTHRDFHARRGLYFSLCSSARRSAVQRCQLSEP